MDSIIYKALVSYFNALEKLGYISYSHIQKLLLLTFYRDFVFHDYRAKLSRDDYHLIERALDCIYGSSCLIPYPDYLKMGKLHLGEMTELSTRVKTLEETDVLKMGDFVDSEGTLKSDIIILSEED